MNKAQKWLRTLRAKMRAERKEFDSYQWAKAELRRMWAEGSYAGDPAQWHPAARLARLAEDSTSPKSLRFLCYKTLLEYIEMPKAAEVRALAGDNGGTTIQISVAPWAAGPRMGGAPKAIEVVATTDVLVGNAEIQARRGFITRCPTGVAPRRSTEPRPASKNTSK
jgi:hypothetical protein